MKSRIIDKDRGWERIKRALIYTSQKDTVAVGVLADNAARKEGEFDNPSIAAVHEFGSADGRIPERSFIRSTISKNQSAYTTILAKLLARVIGLQQTKGSALKILGTKVKADIIRTILSNIPPELSDVTKDRKESSMALVDTGQLKASIDYEVRA